MIKLDPRITELDSIRSIFTMSPNLIGQLGYYADCLTRFSDLSQLTLGRVEALMQNSEYCFQVEGKVYRFFLPVIDLAEDLVETSATFKNYSETLHLLFDDVEGLLNDLSALEECYDKIDADMAKPIIKASDRVVDLILKLKSEIMIEVVNKTYFPKN